MPRPTQPIYLRTQRLRWALKQNELGLLIGVSGNAVSKYERGVRRPRRNTLIALEIVLDVPHADLFPQLRDQIEEVVMRRATRLDAKVRNRSDASSLRKLGLLKELSDRFRAAQPDYEQKG